MKSRVGKDVFITPPMSKSNIRLFSNSISASSMVVIPPLPSLPPPVLSMPAVSAACHSIKVYSPSSSSTSLNLFKVTPLSTRTALERLLICQIPCSPTAFSIALHGSITTNTTAISSLHSFHPFEPLAPILQLDTPHPAYKYPHARFNPLLIKMSSPEILWLP